MRHVRIVESHRKGHWISWANFSLYFICCYVNQMIMKTLHCSSPAAWRGEEQHKGRRRSVELLENIVVDTVQENRDFNTF